KNGLPSRLALSMKSLDALTNTSSNVVMSYFAFRNGKSCMFGTFDMSGNSGSGPSSTILCLPTLPQRGISVGLQPQVRTPPWGARVFARRRLLFARVTDILHVFDLLHDLIEIVARLRSRGRPICAPAIAKHLYMLANFCFPISKKHNYNVSQ